MFTLARISVVVLSGLFLFGEGVRAQVATLYGTVKDASSQPLQGAEIRIQGRDANKIGRIHTDANGRYSYPGLETGTYNVTLVVNGVVMASINNVKTQLGETQTLNFALQKGAARPLSKGKHYVWIPSVTGSHLGVWVEADDDASKVPTGVQQRMKDQGNSFVRELRDEHPGTMNRP